MLRSRSWTRGLAGTLALTCSGAIGGCASDGTPTPLGLPTAEELAATPAADRFLAPIDGPVVGAPTEVYTRIARGAVTCWFGASGPLRGSYVYHANAEPPSKGGKSDIAIFAKDIDAEDPRSLKAFRVLIFPADGGTRVEVENVKLDGALSQRLKGDVRRWAGAAEGCSEAPITGWATGETTEPEPKKGKGRTR